MHTRQGDLFNHISTRIYNPSSGPRITSFFWQLLLRNEKFRANLCFETSEHSVQTADDNRKVISPTLVLYIFKLVLYFN